MTQTVDIKLNSEEAVDMSEYERSLLEQVEKYKEGTLNIYVK